MSDEKSEARLLLERYGEVDAVAAKLPYVSGF